MTKIDTYLQTKKAMCRHHGPHSDWRYRPVSASMPTHNVACILCDRERSTTARRRRSIGKATAAQYKHASLKKTFDATGMAMCEEHAEHSFWYYHARRGTMTCKYCKNDKKIARKKADIVHHLFLAARARSKKKNKDFTITEEYLKDLLNNQTNKCALTGRPFSDDDLASIDRIDSSLGYVEGNIQFVLQEINFMKIDLPQDLFIDLCRLVVKHSIKG